MSFQIIIIIMFIIIIIITIIIIIIWNLGSGSFGNVYSGIDMSTGTRLAVKEVILGTYRIY